jgi:hypothetical protein
VATFDSTQLRFDQTCWTFDDTAACFAVVELEAALALQPQSALAVEIERAIARPVILGGQQLVTFDSGQLRFDQTCWTFDGSTRCGIAVEIEAAFARPPGFGHAVEIEAAFARPQVIGYVVEAEAGFAPPRGLSPAVELEAGFALPRAFGAVVEVEIARAPPPLFAATGAVLSPYHRDILRALAERFGISSPVAYTATSPYDGTVVGGTLVQNLVGGVLTTAAGGPSGDAVVAGMDVEAAGWLEALARRHGLIDPIADTGTLISDGTFAQSVAVSGNTATYTRLS